MATPLPVTAGVLLVARDGNVLMQQRDEHCKYYPLRWGIPGGRVEPGETPLQAAGRELLEETGLRAPAGLRLFWRGITVHHPLQANMFCGPTDAVQDDVVLGEGKAMVFLAPAQIVELPLMTNIGPIILAFLESVDYRRLADR